MEVSKRGLEFIEEKVDMHQICCRKVVCNLLR